MITIVDYGLGNIDAFLNAYKRLNIPARRATEPEHLEDAARVILPGVGHFDHAMKRLEESRMRLVLDDLVLNQKVPVLGICVGMQMLGVRSEEGSLPGLGWIDGEVRALSALDSTTTLPLPHMGWNDVQPRERQGLFAQMDDARFYFLHSFFFECRNPADTLAVSNYGSDFACAVNTQNVYGVQFHPEKSHHFGTQLLKNFADL
jgi:imidazole glycerol-phosphate synthase subunit HisH